MKRSYGVMLAGILCLIFGTVCCQTVAQRQVLVEARSSLRQGDMTARGEDFLRAKSILAGCAGEGDYQVLVEYYLGYADYRLGVVVCRMDKEKAIAYLDSAVEHLERAIEKEGGFAEAHALLASCYGIKISFAPLKGIILGPRSAHEKQKAVGLSPGNPRVALLGAIGTYSTPSLFGGGKEKGLEELKKAAQLFEHWQAADSLQPDWGAAETYSWIGRAYMDRNELILARNAFEQALRIAPDYGWVKYDLLPKVMSLSGMP